ncbi:Zn-dependent M16 (insulinase) family peptidase [Lachnospiraceae bacterium PFB1-21]
MKNLKAYELLREEELADISAQGYLLKHKKTGARVLLIKNDDPNKVFTIGFKTPPSDSTGVAHIMEHSVLCGSKNFPAKDPFVELVKGSLNTFLNAMTYPDKTVYPVASLNDKDFKNLMHVYLDAVFYPKIYEREEIFRQEGWNYKIASPEDEITYNGVVYNEMKGAFSSPESVLERMILNTLLPDTNYGNESGGDPEFIPDLTYEQFLDFHRTYYHPANSYIYLYGDMDFEERLEFLDEAYLADFEPLAENIQVGVQTPFKEDVCREEPYSISSDEDEQNKTYLSYNKVIGNVLDKELYLAFQILDYVLLASPGAYLKKALTEAGIGEDIFGGYDSSIYQPLFSVIAKGANIEDKDRFIQVVEKTLKDLVATGIDRRALEAAINYHEFRFREADFGNYPKGLIYGLQLFDSWLYDENEPFMHLEALATFGFLREQLQTDYYEELITKYLLENTHGAMVNVVPEKGRTGRLDKELADKLAAFKASLSEAEIAELVAKTKALDDYQNAEETQENIEKIPLLKREDLSEEITPIINEDMEVGGVKTVFHDLETNGIGYVNLLFDIQGVGEEEAVYLGILQALLGMVDTKNYTYGQLSDEINVHTGGIGTELDTYVNVNDLEGDFKRTFEIKSKALYQKLPVALEMIKEIIGNSLLEDDKRVKEILAMLLSRMQMRFQNAGHSVAVGRAASYGSKVAKYKDQTAGIAFYDRIKAIYEDFDQQFPQVIRKVGEVAQGIFCKENLLVSFTGRREGLSELEKGLQKLMANLPDKAEVTKPYHVQLEVKNEGFKTAGKVQYVARCGNFVKAGETYTGVLQILKVILSYEYLWQNIRVKGGAYGCMSGFSRDGSGYFVTYRDPHLRRSLEVFAGIPEYLENFSANERELTKYIIGTISNLDQPLTPSVKGERSLNLRLAGVTEEMLKTERLQILNATVEDIRRLAPITKAVMDADWQCVVGSEEKIVEAEDIFKEIRSF